MPGDVDRDRLESAVARARAIAWSTQRDDGSWESYCDQGPAATAQVLVGLRFVDRLDPADAVDAARWLAHRQRRDGSFVAHPYAEQGDLSATACAWAGLRAAGLTDDAEPVKRARAFVEANGGTAALVAKMDEGDVSALFVAMAGLVPARALPEPAHLFALVPPVEAWVERRFNVQIPFMLVQTALLLESLRGESGLLARFERHQALALLDRFQNADGSWMFGDTMHAALGLATLRAIDAPSDDPRATRALRWLEGQKRRDADGLWYSIFRADVWTTAFTARALRATGVAPGHASIARAAAWLAREGIAPPGGAADARGWAFQAGNTTMPDCDDAGVVLGALGASLDADAGPALPDAGASDARAAVDAAMRWLTSMQNADGGWASFQHGLAGKLAGPMMSGPPPVPGAGAWAKLRFFLEPPPEVGDPATEDVTGRVLHGLGKNGITIAAPAAANAVSFLRKQQCASGAFWGRWVVNYLAGTAWVLRGLASIGAPLDADWAQRAIAFVLAKQNPDGGWGEDVASYRDEARAGVGASNPGLTGLVLSALIEAGRAQSDAVAAGIRYLIAEQRIDGSWPEARLLHALVPPDLFYRLPGTPLQLALEALGLYRGALDGRVAITGSETAETAARADAPLTPATGLPAPRDPSGAWNPAFLAAMSTAGDELADAVVRDVFGANDVAAVDDLMAKITRSDDPIPAGLPPRAARYFDETNALPPWADRAKIMTAQRLFTRCGWGIATTLYTSSLPHLYAFPVGARVLRYTQGLTRHAWRRIVETAQFVFDVSDEGSMEPSGRGIRTTQKIRLMHATIRHLELRQASWDTASCGVPINQKQLATTLVTFSSLVVDGIRRMRFDVSDDEAEAWIHLWKVVGSILGIREDLLPRDEADGAQLLSTMEQREWGASPEGAALAAATLDLMRQMLPGPAFAHLPATLVRHLAGDRCADLLAVPAADWTRLLFDAACDLEGWVEGGDHDERVARLAQKGSIAIMKGFAALAREGKGVQFRMPVALVRSWGDGRG